MQDSLWNEVLWLRFTCAAAAAAVAPAHGACIEQQQAVFSMLGSPIGLYYNCSFVCLRLGTCALARIACHDGACCEET